MRTLFFVLLMLSPTFAWAEPAAEPWAGLQFLVGDWNGGGGGKPGEGTGAFSFKLDLGSKVLVRRNFAQYPPKPGQKEGVRHDDLMIVYLAGPLLKAIYFDNEGHVINYAVTTADKTATFESDAGPPGVPRFKLVYQQKDDAAVDLTFSIAPPGSPFRPYITASAKRAGGK